MYLAKSAFLPNAGQNVSDADSSFLGDFFLPSHAIASTFGSQRPSESL